MAVTGSDNSYAGGITYSTPSLSANGTPSGGLSFDFPLASVQSFQNSALSFLERNSARNTGFLQSSMATSAEQVAQSTARASAFLGGVNEQILQVGRDNSANLFSVMGQTQNYATVRTSLWSRIKSGGGCYITTAIAEMHGKPDDCDDLQTLRKFRDEFMRVHHPAMVADYYAHAPAIVKRIKSLPDGGRAMFLMLERQYLAPAIVAVKLGAYDEALNIYTSMVAMAAELVEYEMEVAHV